MVGVEGLEPPFISVCRTDAIAARANRAKLVLSLKPSLCWSSHYRASNITFLFTYPVHDEDLQLRATFFLIKW